MKGRDRRKAVHWRCEGEDAPLCGTVHSFLTPMMTPSFFRVTCKRCIAIAKQREDETDQRRHLK